MLISVKHRAVFVHNPKCAGSSISQALTADPSLEFRRLPTFDDRYIADQHRKNVPEQFRDYYKFCVCRNPYARFISLWMFRMQNENLGKGVLQYAQSIDIRRDYYSLQVRYTSQCDQVFRFEDITKDSAIDTPFGRIEFPHINASSHRDVASYYEDETVEKIIWRKYQDDFRELNYARRGFK